LISTQTFMQHWILVTDHIFSKDPSIVRLELFYTVTLRSPPDNRHGMDLYFHKI